MIRHGGKPDWYRDPTTGVSRTVPGHGEMEELLADLTAIIGGAPEGGFWAICPEIPGAKGQGETKGEAKENLRQMLGRGGRCEKSGLAVGLRGLVAGAVQETISVG